MDTSRRKFVSTLILSSIGVSFVSPLFAKNLLFKPFLAEDIDIPKKLKEAADFRKKKNFQAAEQIYQEVIAQKPDEIRAYDGLKKVILQQDNNDLQKVLDMYASGLTNNPQNAAFYERTATQYASIAQGNKKIARQLGNPEDLLQKAVNYVDKAQKLKPANKNNPESEQYKKLQKRKTIGAATTDARKNKDFKKIRNENKHSYKNNFKDRGDSKIESNLSKLLQRENAHRATLAAVTPDDAKTKRSKQIAKLYVSSIKKSKKKKNAVQAIKKSKDLYNFTQGSENSLHLIKRLCKQYNKPEEAESILRTNHGKKNTFWSGIALFDVLIAKHKKLQTGNLAEAGNLLNSIEQQINRPDQIFEWETRKITEAVYSKKPEAYNSLKDLSKSLVGVSNTHVIDRFNRLCALYFTSLNQKENALKVIEIALGNSKESDRDSLLEKVQMANTNRDDTNPVHRQQLLQLRDKIMNS
jgi:ribosome-binding factor A